MSPRSIQLNVISPTSKPKFHSKFPTTLPQQPNLSKSEKSALRSLHINPNIRILPADKGNTTVILDKDDYLAEADHQLSDRSTYQPLASNPIQSYNQDLHHPISTASPPQGLSKTDLLTPQPRTPSLYLLPKIHKPGNPGHTIVSSNGSPTECISAYINAHPLLNPPPPMSRILTTFLT